MRPSDPQRVARADALLAPARAAAAAAGVTRLADITRLDRVGLPVWQAVRPFSRALSVHQGKGACAAEAQLGALLEAVESDAAERFAEVDITSCWNKLDPEKRPGHLEDFGRDRTRPPQGHRTLSWVEATRADGTTLLVPFACVSLDFTILKNSPFERSSAGLATGTTREEARRVALFELIERDACARFFAEGPIERLECEIDLASVAFDWFAALNDRLRANGLDLRLFAAASPLHLPVFIASVTDTRKKARPYAATIGHAAHPDPEIALYKSVAEALQSRLTLISGARDDCWPWLYTEDSHGITGGIAPPTPSGFDQIPFTRFDRGPDEFDDLVGALHSLGAEESAFLTIAEPDGFFVVRAFAPGLGSLVKEPRL